MKRSALGDGGSSPDLSRPETVECPAVGTGAWGRAARAKSSLHLILSV